MVNLILTLLQIALGLAVAILAGRLVGVAISNRRRGERRPLRRIALVTSLLALLLVAALAAGWWYRAHKPRPMKNPFFSEWTTPFGVPPFDRIRPEHFEPAFERAMSLHLAEIDAIVSNNDEATFENTILAYDNSGLMLERVSLVFGLLCAADTNERMQQIEAKVSPQLAAHTDRVMLDERLFERVRSVYERRGALGLDAEQLRLTEKIYRGFVRGGALLDAEAKAALKETNEALSRARVRYASNLLHENNDFRLELSREDLAGLPAGVKEAARQRGAQLGAGEKWVFTLSKPSLLPFITYSDRRDLREQLYKGYLQRGDRGNEYDNKELINEIVRLRTERARLLGYDSHAAYVLDEQMAKTPAAVYELLDALWTPALENAKKELAEMQELKSREGDSTAFESWDWWYYAEKLRKQKYALDEEMLRPYFSLDNVRNGIFELSNRLYGITFRPAKVPLYNEECLAYEVIDRDDSHLGILYLDFFPRPGKSQGAWCGEYRPQRYENGERVAPVVSIVCNFTRPMGNDPALLSLDETTTFFHEFGHALHALFSDVKYRGLQGVERDFVELPSQIMENWAVEPEMLKKYALHYRTNEPISDYMIGKIRRSALFNQGFTTTELLAASLSDMDIHTMSEYEPFDVNAFEREALTQRRGLIPQIEPRYRYPYFSHIFDGGYSAGYYSYIWAEVLDKDAFAAFVESGDVFNRSIADDFRKKVLARGGSADGMTLYRDFRGADPSREPLLRARGFITETESEPAAPQAAPVQPAADGGE